MRGSKTTVSSFALRQTSSESSFKDESSRKDGESSDIDDTSIAANRTSDNLAGPVGMALRDTAGPAGLSSTSFQAMNVPSISDPYDALVRNAVILQSNAADTKANYAALENTEQAQNQAREKLKAASQQELRTQKDKLNRRIEELEEDLQ